MHWCEVCSSTICDDCRIKRCKSGENNCNDCVEIISTKLLEENKKMQVENKELRDEIKRLKYANKSLWEQNAYLGDEVEELTQKMDTIRMLASSF